MGTTCLERQALSCEVLSLAAYSLGLVPSDYHLFALVGYALAEQRFGSYEDVKKGSMNGYQQNVKIFIGVVFISCPKDGKNV